MTTDFCQIIINMEDTIAGEPPKEKFVEYEESDKWWMLALGIIKEEKVLKTIVLDRCILNNFEYTQPMTKVDDGYRIFNTPSGEPILTFRVESLQRAKVSYV
jgi:hypothetical protein